MNAGVIASGYTRPKARWNSPIFNRFTIFGYWNSIASAQLLASRARLPTQFLFNVGCVADGGGVAKAHPTR